MDILYIQLHLQKKYDLQGNQFLFHQLCKDSIFQVGIHNTKFNQLRKKYQAGIISSNQILIKQSFLGKHNLQDNQCRLQLKSLSINLLSISQCTFLSCPDINILEDKQCKMFSLQLNKFHLGIIAYQHQASHSNTQEDIQCMQHLQLMNKFLPYKIQYLQTFQMSSQIQQDKSKFSMNDFKR